ncbi:MAG: aspartate ammonia-lyase [Candidatus Omnitrophica bacterium]|nr:aspartate ammonia-lyase [Candidatus Omnitrophota bacterium]
MEYRIETDLLGEMEIPADAYWGIHSRRARDNFPFSGALVNPSLITALAMVKKACCAANAELGYIDNKRAEAINRACDEVIKGKFKEQFVVAALQGGAGTSTNMNVNEVISNRALELLGKDKGDCSVIHPIETLNLHQSTNDVYPTAVKVAVIFQLKKLSAGIALLQGAFQKKEKEFAGIVKIGRTELQEAVPMTLGAEFSAFAGAFARDRWRVFKCEERVRTVNIGGTAVGTGLTAPRSYIFLVIEKLRELTGLGLTRGENLVDHTANSDSFVEISGILKAHAQNLIKIANDLRLLHLLKEIELPKAQAGSSIMPGKVNPVIMEAAIQAGLKVIANDLLITEAASRGTFQINEFMPLLSHAILESLDMLIEINNVFASCVTAIQAGNSRHVEAVESSLAIMTAFLPVIGYEKATKLLKEFSSSQGKSIKDFLTNRLGKELVDKTLSAGNLTSLGHKENAENT